MKFRIAALMCFIFAMAASLVAQSKVVTNADLEKYRQERLKHELDYRENYAKLGLPSPEELERRREKSRIETEQLSEKLRSERLERERIQSEREARERLAQINQDRPQIVVEPQNYETEYFWSNGRRYRTAVRQTYYQQPGYFAGGQFWPTGSRTPLQPLISRPRKFRR